jgi:hypothetical protein
VDICMTYTPNINDYVVWTRGIEGWVYFKHEEYITIETDVWEKSKENYELCPIHRNDRVLVLCYHDQWNELTYIKSRKSVYEE